MEELTKVLPMTIDSSGSDSSGAGWKNRVRTIQSQILAGSPLFPFDGRDPRAAEHYRIIRTKILQDRRRLCLLTITSPQGGDGKSVSAINIAGVLALREETSVLLVDADFRRSAVSGLLGLPASPGLVEVLSGECSLELAVVRVNSLAPGLFFLPAGHRAHNPTELFESRRWALCCAEFRKEFDLVIIDTPPIGVVADCELVQAASDGVILIIRPDSTSRRRCAAALQAIPKERLIGVIANCVPDWFMTKSLYHDYGYYRERND